MSLHALAPRLPHRATARRVAVVVALLFVAATWRRVVGAASRRLAATAADSLAVAGLVSTALLLAGFAALAYGYAAYRDVDVGLRWPSRDDATPVVLAVLAPLVGVAATVALGALTGVPYGALAKTHYPTLDALVPVLAVAGLDLLVTVPGLLVVCHLLVQTPLREALGARATVAATTVLAAVALVSDTGGLAVVPATGRLVAVVVLAGLVALGALANARLDAERTRALAGGALSAVAAVVVAAALFVPASLAGVAYALARVGVLAVGAYGYERSGSLAVPAFAYLSFALAEFGVLLAVAGGPAPF